MTSPEITPNLVVEAHLVLEENRTLNVRFFQETQGLSVEEARDTVHGIELSASQQFIDEAFKLDDLKQFKILEWCGEKPDPRVALEYWEFWVGSRSAQSIFAEANEFAEKIKIFKNIMSEIISASEDQSPEPQSS